MIIAGHCRRKAALELNLEVVPVTLWDVDDNEAEAHMLADNKISEHSTWIDELVHDLLHKHQDLPTRSATGFTEEETAFILKAADFQPDEAGAAGQSTLDSFKPKMVTCPNCQTEFDARQPYSEN